MSVPTEAGARRKIKPLEASFMETVVEMAGTRLEEPSPQAVERFVSTARLRSPAVSGRPLRGTVAFDSWSRMPDVALRDVGIGWMRRLCLEAAALALEIVAVRRRNDWQYTARVYESGRSTAGWTLRAGRRKVLPRSLGFFQWNAPDQPRVFRIESNNQTVIFQGVSWARSMTR